MSAEWREHKFGELCDISRGASPRPIKDYISDEGMPWVKIADATASGSKFITKTKEKIKLEGVSKSVTVRPGDLILSNSATPGLPRFMKIEACIHDGWMLLKNFRGLDKEFAYWLLLHERMNLVAQGNGSVFTNLKTDILRNHRVSIPELKQQKAIAKLLNSLSDKIQNTVEINQTLEQMAQAIFKSWFVDFEPVKAKIAALEAGGSEEDALLAAMQAISGKSEAELTRLQAEQSEQYAELRATAELFPSAMQDSELGEIPEGWEVTDLKSSTIEIRRGISPKYTEEGGIQVINQKCIRNHKVDFSLARRNDTSKRKIDGREIQIGDVLVNSTGVGTLGRLAPVRHLPEPSVADSHITVIRANNRLISNAFLAGLMITSEPLIEASGAGSTGQTELRKQVLEEIVFARPSLKLSRAYEGAVEPMGQQMACIERQLVSLASTRDVILPKLLSGDLSVPNKGNQPKAEPLSPLQGVE